MSQSLNSFFFNCQNLHGCSTEMMSSTKLQKPHFHFLENLKEALSKAKKIGEDDPRRLLHSLKVGLALTLVSLFYYFRPLYDGFGQAGMWAILTVVVVFEFSVGGTISKSLNRGGATLLAASLGFGAEYLASLCGKTGEPIVLGFMVFILATVSTFTRFFPHVKRRYDYGVLIFILTFSLVAVSGARVTELLQLAHQRLSTILIGGATCMVISLTIFPVWAGQDLHNLIAANVGKLAASLEGFGGKFCVANEDLQSHKSVLNSKPTEDSLANFAWWEPGHGRFKFNHPWKLYLNIGGLLRQCACQIETLNRCVHSKPQLASEFQKKIQPACEKMSIESGKALRELSTAIKTMTSPSSAVEIHLKNSKAAADELKTITENSSFPTKAELEETAALLVIASVLTDIIKFVEKISVSVNELSQQAGFKEVQSPTVAAPQLLHRGVVNPVDDQVVIDIDKPVEAVVIEIVEIPTNSPEIKK